MVTATIPVTTFDSLPTHQLTRNGIKESSCQRIWSLWVSAMPLWKYDYKQGSTPGLLGLHGAGTRLAGYRPPCLMLTLCCVTMKSLCRRLAHQASLSGSLPPLRHHHHQRGKEMWESHNSGSRSYQQLGSTCPKLNLSLESPHEKDVLKLDCGEEEDVTPTSLYLRSRTSFLSFRNGLQIP